MREIILNNAGMARSPADKTIDNEGQALSGVVPVACCNGTGNQTAQIDYETDPHRVIALTINGMHCSACVSNVETAFTSLSGVRDALVDVAARAATVWYDPQMVGMEDFQQVSSAAGYHIEENTLDNLKPAPESRGQVVNFLKPSAYLLGVAASLTFIGIYLGMNTLTADWYFAKIQFSEYRWWIISLSIGLGIQVTLFTMLRDHLRGKKKTAAKSSMAASGGVSAVAMMACCSHYLAALIPLLGISFLSATAVASIEQYQAYFFLTGLVSCLLGIALMVRMMRKHGMFMTGIPDVLSRLKPGRIGNV